MNKLKEFLYTSEYFDWFFDSYYAVRRFFKSIYRFFYYGWKLKDSYDFDFGYTEEVLFLKLKRLQHCMNTDPYHMNLDNLREELKTATDEFEISNHKANIQAHKALNICVAILTRRDKKVYSDLVGLSKFYENIGHRSVKVEGEDYYTFETYTLDGTPYDKDKQRELYLREHEIEDRDKKILYALLYKYSQNWWT